jgi:hypothetical protein
LYKSAAERAKEDAVTERQNSATDVVEILRDRLGATYRADIDGGRDEIVRVIADGLSVDRDEAATILHQQMEAGRIRYVVGTETDPVEDRAAQHDERSDQANRRDDDGITDRRDTLRASALPGAVGPAGGTSGLMGSPVAPLVAGGTTTPPATPLAADAPLAASADDLQRGGYWEFLGDRAGVVPSSTRKGQVEPRGT